MLLSELISLIEKELSPLYKQRTIQAYKSTSRSVFSLFKEDMPIGELFNTSQMAQYQDFLTKKGLKRNSISFYNRSLRAIYNRAVDMGVCFRIPGLFTRAFTGLEETVKRSVDTDSINCIAGVKLSPELAFSRDMFMLCFYLQGMAFVDLAHLKKSDLQNGYIIYNRKKSNSLITVKVEKEALMIIKRYTHLTKESEYILPIITNSRKGQRIQYQSALRTHNRRLDKVAEKAGLSIVLSSYVARHSWATMAYRNNVPTAVIKEAMGHKTEETTRIYLASLDKSVLGKANKLVINALKKEGRKNKRVRLLARDGHESDTNIKTKFQIRKRR